MTTTTTTTTKISAPRRLQNADFPPPLLLVYETHNECRLGKKPENARRAMQFESHRARINLGASGWTSKTVAGGKGGWKEGGEAGAEAVQEERRVGGF